MKNLCGCWQNYPHKKGERGGGDGLPTVYIVRSHTDEKELGKEIEREGERERKRGDRERKRERGGGG